MASNQEELSALEIAHVLFMDIVGYSTLPIDKQTEILGQLQSVVRSSSEFRRAEERNQLIRLPSGDGMALVFFGEPEPPVRCALEIAGALWGHSEIKVRIGLHTGPVYRVSDINANRNVAGGGINVAQRVMDCGDAGHILVSKSLADVLGQVTNWAPLLHALGPVIVKHGVQVDLFNLYTKEVGNPERPKKVVTPGLPLGPRDVKPLAWALAIAGSLLVLLLVVGIVLHFWPKPPRHPITLAVLPFQMLTPTGDFNYLGIAIPDSIISRLSAIRRIRVRPTTAILGIEGQAVDSQEAGRAMASDYVLTGTVQKASEVFRVNVQLVRVEDGKPLWGEPYNIVRRDLFSLQDEVAEKVAANLQFQLTKAERDRLSHFDTQNEEAYELYLKGRAYMVRHTEEGLRDAANAFRNAIRLDPSFALAHAGLAMASAEIPSRFAHEAEMKNWKAQAEQEAARALELDPELAEAHQALAAVFGHTEYRWNETVSESRKALELNPSLDLPHYYLAHAFYHLGLLEETEKEVSRALEINPSDRVEAERNRGVAAFLSGRFADAVPLLEEVREIGGKPQSDLWLARAYYYRGEITKAEAMLKELTGAPWASTATRAEATLAAFLAARGETQKASQMLENALKRGYMDHHVAYGLATAYAQLGLREEALHWLRNAAETGFPCFPWYERDPLLAPLRNQDDFKDFMVQLRRLWEQAKLGFTSVALLK